VQGVHIPAADNVIATYPIVAVKGATNAVVAGAFIAFVLSTKGQSVLATFGFLSAA
jgi:molybdate transport system substrate-binding protein